MVWNELNAAAQISWVVASLACVIGGSLGVLALRSPEWAGRLVRLQPDPNRREGRAELRANYGGLFTAVHLFVLSSLWVGSEGLFFAATAGVMWAGVGLARMAFMGVDKAVTSYNIGGAVFELLMAAALLAPLVAAGGA